MVDCTDNPTLGAILGSMSGPVVYKGKTYPHLNALSDAEAVVANSTVDGRLKSGWPLEKALKTPAQKLAPANPITTYKEKTYPTFKALAEAEGVVPYKTVEARLRLGWPIEEALKTPPREITYKGRTYPSFKALVEAESEATLKAVEGRIARGWSLEEALETPLSNEITYKGKTYPSTKALIRAEGVVSVGAIESRLTKGWPLEEALKTPLSNEITYNGKTYPNLKALVEAETDIPYSTVESRIASGWSLEKAINTPVQYHAHADPITTYKGRTYPSFKALVEAVGTVPYATVAVRVHLGWPLEKALNKPVLEQAPKKPIKTTYKGKTFNTLVDLVAEHGLVPSGVVSDRLRRGWKLDDALKEPKEYRAKRDFTVDGKTYKTMSALARAFKLPYTTVLSRARSGFSDKEIVYGRRRKKTTPKGKVKGHSIVIAGKIYPSKTAAAKDLGIDPRTFLKRMIDGYTPEQAAELEERPTSPGAPSRPGAPRPVIVKGKPFKSLMKAAAHYGVSYDRARHRTKKGATIEQVLGLEPLWTANSVEFKGKMYESRAALAEAYGLRGDLVSKRINQLGWTLEEALGIIDRPKSSLNKGKFNEKFFERNPEEKEHPAVLYLVNITHTASGQSFSKIGITVYTVEGRLAKASGYSYKEITSKETTLYDAWQLEQMILEDYAESGFVWERTDFGGRTECFNFSDEQIAEIRDVIDEL